MKEKIKHIWAYEEKDDKTQLGMSVYIHDDDKKFKLAKLRDDWHWCVELEDCDCDK